MHTFRRIQTYRCDVPPWAKPSPRSEPSRHRRGPLVSASLRVGPALVILAAVGAVTTGAAFASGATTGGMHKRAPISVARALDLPSSNRCVSGRALTFKMRKIDGVKWISATVNVNRKRFRKVTGSALSKTVKLKGVPAGRFTLEITARTRDGRSVTATRRYHTCATRTPPPGAVQVAVGDVGGQTFACALTPTGGLECWGNNSHGELGDGTTTTASVPVNVHGLTSGVTEVAAGHEFACAVTRAGGAKCWGSEYDGELGNGVSTTTGNAYSSNPVDVTGLTSGVRSIAAGDFNACAVTVVGAVECWGTNFTGVLGTNGGPSYTESAVPVQIAGLSSGVVAVSVGAGFACALTSGGAVECWGDNGSGELGNGSAGGQSASVVDVTGLTSGVRSLSAGSHDACAVTSTRGVWCWGDNNYGELGNGIGYGDSASPESVSGLSSGQASVSVGFQSACAVSIGGAVKCWGYNYDGTLGDGTETNSDLPVSVSGLSAGAASVAVSTYTACALTTMGAIKCWGYVPFSPYLSDTPVHLPWFG